MPFDVTGLRDVIKKHQSTLKQIVVVEDHYGHGSLSKQVRKALLKIEACRCIDHLDLLCVNDVPRSGTPAKLEQLFKIDGEAIRNVLKAHS